ncbi:hypothetical protein [Geodermatophilus sp. SYSU D00700]
MDRPPHGEPDRWLFDPDSTRALVLARRCPGGRAVEDVVSDLVWGEVVRLLRWATAGTHATAALRTGIWWRLAAGCAALLRRLPELSAEIAEPWSLDPPPAVAPGVPAADRIGLVAERLAALLRSREPVPLRRLAAEVDALGEAAVQALADASFDHWPDDASRYIVSVIRYVRRTS